MSRNTSSETTALNLKEILVRPVRRFEEKRYQALMQAHHYLGAMPKIGKTLWYVAIWCGQWVALGRIRKMRTFAWWFEAMEAGMLE